MPGRGRRSTSSRSIRDGSPRRRCARACGWCASGRIGASSRSGQLARYETVWRDEPVETRRRHDPAGRPAPLTPARSPSAATGWRSPSRGGLAITSVRFRAGWVGGGQPGRAGQGGCLRRPPRLCAGRHRARAHHPALRRRGQPAVLTDRVHLAPRDRGAGGGTEVDVPVDAAWGPGAYVAVARVPPGGRRRASPAARIGLAWVGIDPAARTLDVAIAAPDAGAPRASAWSVPVPDRSPGAWVTLAAVDEGILRLTRFASPDPVAHFLGRRRARPRYPRRLGPADPARRGRRDRAAPGRRRGRQRAAATSRSGPSRCSPAGAGRRRTASPTVPLDLPDFDGQVRLMAVAWQGNRIGAAADAADGARPGGGRGAAAALPRAGRRGAAAGAAAQPRPAGRARSPRTLTAEGAARAGRAGAARPPRSRRARRPCRPPRCAPPAPGAGVLRLAVTGPDGFQRDARGARSPCAPPRARHHRGRGRRARAGRRSARCTPAARPLRRRAPGAPRPASAAPVRYDAAARCCGARALPAAAAWSNRPASGLAFALLPDGAAAGRGARGAAAIRRRGRCSDKQRYDGGFGLWSAQGEAETWPSAYATEFLLRARSGRRRRAGGAR